MIIFFRVQDVEELSTNIDLASFLQERLPKIAAPKIDAVQ